MLIAQITDIHLGFAKGGGFEDNAKRLRRVVAMLMTLQPRPDVLLVTGDMSDHGDAASYRRLKRYLSGLPMPVHFCMGNHDARATFLEQYPGTPTADGFIQYTLEDFPLRIVVTDTLEVGRHGGGFCATRAAWLEARLAEATDRPTLLVLHHPPIDHGITWMSVGEGEAWARRLREVVERHPQIVAMICGHVHRQIVAPFAHTTVRVCSSVQPQVMLDLKAMDLETPDDRPMIVSGPPAFALHRWTGSTLVSHYSDVDEQDRMKILARYTPKMQKFMQHLAHEREKGREA